MLVETATTRWMPDKDVQAEVRKCRQRSGACEALAVLRVGTLSPNR
jgi:hypothetical protein